MLAEGVTPNASTNAAPASARPRWCRCLPGTGFRRKQFWSLAATPWRWPQLAREEALIVHYPLYVLPVIWHRRLVGLSHGVTWDDRPGSRAARLKRALARLAFRRCRAFVANDTCFLREVGLNIRPRERLFEEVAPGRWLIPNCVDTDWWVPTPGRRIYAPSTRSWCRATSTATGASTWRSRRCPRVLRSHPEAHLVVAGGKGDPGYEEEVRALTANLKLQEQVRFLGSVPWREMRAVYTAARLTVIPSLCGEGTSLSALESMACGTPVVATRVGGLPDLPVALAKPEPGALAEAICRALDAREELADTQQAEVRANYHLRRWAGAWQRVIAELAAP